LAHFYSAVDNQNGKTVLLPGYDDTLLALHLHQIIQIPQRLGVAGGPHKVSAILGALRGGWMTALVTDHDTAKEIMQLA
jgi:DNA-binding transcriptional regulator LsrR (DeoR family)